MVIFLKSKFLGFKRLSAVYASSSATEKAQTIQALQNRLNRPLEK
jgi:hypothetical protein